MMLDETMRSELAARSDAVALACMDTRSGLLLGLEVRPDIGQDLELEALVAVQSLDEDLVASARWVHAYARVPAKRDLILVGLAPGDANVALFQEWIRKIAERVGVAA